MSGLAVRRLTILLVALVPVVLSGCVSSLVYFPDSEIRMTPEKAGLPYEWVYFTASDGTGLSGWYVPKEDARGVILFLHGNGGNISHYVDSLVIFNRLGFSTFIPDYRGYGRSRGRPSEEGTYLDAHAGWEYVVNTLRVSPERVVIFGRSMGGAVAARLAGTRPSGGVVLESSFTSIADVVSNLYWWAPGRLLFGNMYGTESSVGGIRAPVLVIHSPDDELVPYAHGERLFRLAPEPKQFLRIRGSHNTGFMESRPAYEAGLDAFLRRHINGGK